MSPSKIRSDEADGRVLRGKRNRAAIVDAIYELVLEEHQPTARQVAERAGVCRDFAHLGIAFCRAIGIPARFCSAYAYGLNPPDFHAYFEAYLGNSWYIFDPTRLAPQTSFVKIGTGHDAADLSFATIIGNANMKSIEITMISLSTDEKNNIVEPKFTTQPITSGHS